MRNPSPFTVRQMLVIIIVTTVVGFTIDRLSPDKWWVAALVTFVGLAVALKLVTPKPLTRAEMAFTAIFALAAGLAVRFYGS